VTIVEAAAVLGLSPKSVHRYRRRGLLRAEKSWGGGVLEQEVEAMQRARQSRSNARLSPTDRAAIEAVRGDLPELADRLDKLRCIMGVGRARPPLGEVETATLWTLATMPPIDVSSPHVSSYLGELLPRVRHTDLEAMSAASGDPHPWRPLLHLATSLALAVDDPALQLEFASARQQLERHAWAWCEAQGLGPRQTRVLLAGVRVDRRRFRNRRPPRQLPHSIQLGPAGSDSAERR
jgi:hypothetical protein